MLRSALPAGEKTLKNLFMQFWWDANTVIADFKNNLLVITAHDQANISTIRRELNGVLDQINQRPLKLFRVALKIRCALLYSRFQVNVVILCQWAHLIQGVFDQQQRVAYLSYPHTSLYPFQIKNDTDDAVHSI